jgi:hypothetical protein
MVSGCRGLAFWRGPYFDTFQVGSGLLTLDQTRQNYYARTLILLQTPADNIPNMLLQLGWC